MVLPILLAGGAIAAGSYAAGWLSNNGGDSNSKKEVLIESASEGAVSSIFPTVEAAPFSIASPTYDYSPSEQNVYHQPYETYQPTYTDSRQYDITYPVYNYITDSNGAVITNKKDATLENKNTSTPTNTQSYTPTNDSGNSSGIDPLILIGGAALVLIALGGVAIVSKK